MRTEPEVVRGLVLWCELVVNTYNLMGDSKSRMHTSSFRPLGLITRVLETTGLTLLSD